MPTVLYRCLTSALYSVLADDEERGRLLRNRTVPVELDDESDGLRGGAGDLVDSDDGNQRGRARLMAIFAQLLSSDADSSPMDAIRFLRAMAEDATEASLSEGREDEGGGGSDGEEDMDTAE